MAATIEVCTRTFKPPLVCIATGTREDVTLVPVTLKLSERLELLPLLVGALRIQRAFSTISLPLGREARRRLMLVGLATNAVILAMFGAFALLIWAFQDGAFMSVPQSLLIVGFVAFVLGFWGAVAGIERQRDRLVRARRVGSDRIELTIPSDEAARAFRLAKMGKLA